MRIYLLTDMEGVSGICDERQVNEGTSAYAVGQRLLMADVNAAIDGAFAGGASEVVVNDGHGGGFNFILEEMDPRASYECPHRSEGIMPSLPGAAGMIMVGQHSRAGTLGGFLDHTQSSLSWFRYFINDVEAGEIAQAAAYAGHYGVPLIMLAGDEAACREAAELCPGLHVAAVKRGLGRQRAHCLHPQRARALIREQAAQAVQDAANLRPWQPSPPITLTLTLCRTDMAEGLATAPGVERLDARTVRKVVADARGVYW